MANFDNSQAKNTSVRNANNLLPLINHIYTSGKAVQAMMALYQAGTDPVFNGAINALFNASERAELGQMLGQVNSLIADWEANHSAAIGIA